MDKQNETDKISVTPVKTFTHATAGTLEAGKSYPLEPRIANRLLAGGLVNPSSGEYSTKVIASVPVVGNANPPSQAAGATVQSSASPVARVSPQKTASKSASGGKSAPAKKAVKRTK